MKKELRPIHDDVSCDICGRTILKGERTEAVSRSGRPAAHRVRAVHRPGLQRGLDPRVRARANAGLDAQAAGAPVAVRPDAPPARRRAVPAARGGAARLRGRVDANGGDPLGEPAAEDVEAVAAEPPPPPPPPPPARARAASRPRRRDARHVRAVPTNAQVKVERALELFNNSEHVRTIGGIARTLGRAVGERRAAPRGAQRGVDRGGLGAVLVPLPGRPRRRRRPRHAARQGPGAGRARRVDARVERDRRWRTGSWPSGCAS